MRSAYPYQLILEMIKFNSRKWVSMTQEKFIGSTNFYISINNLSISNTDKYRSANSNRGGGGGSLPILSWVCVSDDPKL